MPHCSVGVKALWLTPTEQEIQLLHINQSTSTDSSAKKHDHKKDNKRKKIPKQQKRNF